LQGLLTLASSSYLISILRREPVAQLWGKPVYVITDVALIPITSQQDAENTIKKAAASLRRRPEVDDASSSLLPDNGDSETMTSTDDTVCDDYSASETALVKLDGRKVGEEKDPGIIENVIGRKGLYGRFADKWFSNRGWTKENRKLQGMSTETEVKDMHTGRKLADSRVSHDKGEEHGMSNTELPSPENLEPSPSVHKPEQTANMDEALLKSVTPKLVYTTRLLLSSRTFFFSYDNDLTHRFSSQSKSSRDLPLHKQADPQVCEVH